MGLYLPNMEMPEGKEVFLRIDEKGEVYVYGSYPTELHKAVPVPPHGRLIDADALVKKQPIPELGAPSWLIEQAPTIIPASEEGV